MAVFISQRKTRNHSHTAPRMAHCALRHAPTKPSWFRIKLRKKYVHFAVGRAVTGCRSRYQQPEAVWHHLFIAGFLFSPRSLTPVRYFVPWFLWRRCDRSNICHVGFWGLSFAGKILLVLQSARASWARVQRTYTHFLVDATRPFSKWLPSGVQ